MSGIAKRKRISRQVNNTADANSTLDKLAFDESIGWLLGRRIGMGGISNEILLSPSDIHVLNEHDHSQANDEDGERILDAPLPTNGVRRLDMLINVLPIGSGRRTRGKPAVYIEEALPFISGADSFLDAPHVAARWLECDSVHVSDSSGLGHSMRGEDQRSEGFFSYVGLETRIAPDHPLRAIRELVDAALLDLSRLFDQLCARRAAVDPAGAAVASTAAASLLHGALATVFCKNRDRLLDGDIAAKFMASILNLPQVRKFSVAC